MRFVVSVLPEWSADARRNEEPEGSGIVIHDGSLVATANHVIGPANKVRVRTWDGRVGVAKIVFRDPKTDIAFLRTDGEQGFFTETGRPIRADKACAIGNAFGLDLSVTCGVVSAIGVTGTGFNRIEDFVQTDAAVNPGMSGGALVDKNGKLIGMLSAIFTKQSDSNIGVNFAVSTPLLYSVLHDFLDNGQLDRPKSGLVLKPAKKRTGAEIVCVANGSVEEKAGLKPGDIIKRIGRERVVRPGTYERALALIDKYGHVSMEVRRKGQRLLVGINFKSEENQ